MAIEAPRKLSPASVAAESPAMEVEGLTLSLGGRTILREITFTLPARGITMVIGPSGAGKSSLLRCLNRLHEGWRGRVTVDGRGVRRWPGGDAALRRHVGLIAQRPTVFPGTVRANVVFGLRGWLRRRRAHALVEDCLRRAALWGEVGERLAQPAAQLSMGQQQRLCLARALAVSPRLLLLDEPTASLDPRSTRLIERSLQALAGRIPLLWVTHDLDQARRLGDEVLFLCEGRLMEAAAADEFFSAPRRLESREFLRWKVCDCEQ